MTAVLILYFSKLTLFRMGKGREMEGEGPPTSFSHVTSTNVGDSLRNSLNFSFDLFATLM